MKKPYHKTLRFNWPRKYYGRLNSVRLMREFEREKKNWNALQKRASFSGLEIANRLEAIEEIFIRRDLKYSWSGFK